MFDLILMSLVSLLSGFRSRAAMQAEIIALRHQLTVLQRSQKPKRLVLNRCDRCLWVWLSRLWSGWRASLIIVKPETVIGWHRQGFRWYWTWKIRHGRPGRPQVPKDTRDLIRRMSRQNPLWGAPRIHAELMKLSIKISEASVAIAHASISPWIKIRQTHGPVQSVGRIIACREIGGLHHRYERVA
jgi:putative transposase